MAKKRIIKKWRKAQIEFLRLFFRTIFRLPTKSNCRQVKYYCNCVKRLKNTPYSFDASKIPNVEPFFVEF